MRTTHRLAAVLAAAALAVTACGNGDPGDPGSDAGSDTGAPSPSGEPIRIGAIFDRTGATSDVGSPFGDGALAYVEWVNANGGIEGRSLEVLHADYAYDVAQAEQLYSQYASRGVVAFSGWGTGDTEALRPKITADEIPFVSASYSEELVDPAHSPYNFVPAVTYSDQMRIALNHIASVHGGEHVEVAVFHHDSPFGLSPVGHGRDYIEAEGYAIGYRNYAMPSGATDYFGELSQAMSQGADYIIIQNVSSPAAQLARNVAEQSLDVTVVCLNWCADEGFAELAGDAAEGALGILPWAPPTQASGDISDVEAYLASKGRTLDDIGLHFTQGWYHMHVLAEAIRKVVADGDEVTGPAIRAALETLGPIATAVSEPIEFSADSHAGMRSSRVYEVQDGVWTPISDGITP